MEEKGNQSREKSELFPYQEEGAKWLAKRKVALLADEMGLGKSAQAIRAADAIGARSILVVCPATLRHNWIREFQKFSNSQISLTPVLDGNTRPLNHSEISSWVSSYDLVAKRPQDYVRPWELVILDEAHYLKNPDTKRTQALFGKHRIVHQAKRVWALSGTPMPNHPGELWSLLHLFGATPKRYWDFVNTYCNTISHTYGTQIVGAKREKIPELKSLLSKIMLRRRKEEVMRDLPPIRFADLVVYPPKEGVPIDLLEMAFPRYYLPSANEDLFQREIAKEETLLKSFLEKLHEADRATFNQGELQAMSASIATLRRYTGLLKVPAIVDIVAEELRYDAYPKIVIFAIHTTVIDTLRERLHEFGAVTIYGKTPIEKRQKHIDKFQTNPKCRVLIGQIQAAGTGITLTASNQVLFAEQSFVPGENAQAAMRCHRIGQKNPVLVRTVGLYDSLDERISQILKQKMRDITALFQMEGLLDTTWSDTYTEEPRKSNLAKPPK